MERSNEQARFVTSSVVAGDGKSRQDRRMTTKTMANVHVKTLSVENDGKRSGKFTEGWADFELKGGMLI